MAVRADVWFTPVGQNRRALGVIDLELVPPAKHLAVGGQVILLHGGHMIMAPIRALVPHDWREDMGTIPRVEVVETPGERSP
jgi:hypothetical protein